MNLKLILLLTAIVKLLANCGQIKAVANEKRSADNTTESAMISPVFGATTWPNDIVGTWKLIMESYDKNFNSKLDDEERNTGMKNSTPQSLHDYKMRFNADGTCKIESIYKAESYNKSTYKIIEEDGKKMLTVQLARAEGSNNDPTSYGGRRYQIISNTRDELLLLAVVSGVGYTFWLFKKA